MVQPEKRFKVGACTASIFANEVNTAEGTTNLRSVSLQRIYKDKKDGSFKHTSSLKTNDIPKAILALSKAYEYLTLDEKAE